jgi:hypothetical protein
MHRSGLIALLLLAGCATPSTAPDASTSDGSSSDTSAPDAGTSNDAALPPFPTITPLLVAGNATLFVGNSYTFVNDLPSVYRAAASALPFAPLRVESVAFGGYTLAQHAMDAATDGTALATFLRTGTPDQTAWDVVILQDQSQIPGFPDGNPELTASLDGASALGALLRARGAAAVLYLTWGRERGDDANPGLYPDFLTMEARLEAGYRAMAARLDAEGVRVRIAPVGPAFAIVHDDVIASGGDPLVEGGPFDLLYAADGSHPGPRGTYLAACVILGTITGIDPASYPDGAGLMPDEARAMRLVARRALSDWR